MIRLNHISKIYQLDKETSFHALSDISLSIKDGEMVGLVGPSGCGKSTLMHIMGLLDKPTTGEITINEKPVGTLTDDDLSILRNKTVGFVFQQFNLIPKLTILENVLLPTIYARHNFDDNPKDKALQLLERFGIANKINSYPNKISGGQQQRAAIARALIMNPTFILADEPTGNLDSKNGNEILDLLIQLNKIEHHTIVIVTHDPNVAKITKRSFHMRDGHMI